MLLFSEEEENEEFEDMLNSMRDVLVSTGKHVNTTVQGQSKETTITQQQKSITEYDLLLIVLHKNDSKPFFSSHIDQLKTNGSL